MEEPKTITLPVIVAGNCRRVRRKEFTEEQIRFFQTYKDEFPSNRGVTDAKARRAARLKRNEVALAESSSAGTIAAAADDEQLVPKRPRISTATGTRPPPVYRGPLLNMYDLGKSTGTMTQNPAAAPSGTRPPPVYRGPLFNKDDLGKSTETMTLNPAAAPSGTKVDDDGGSILKHPQSTLPLLVTSNDLLC